MLTQGKLHRFGVWLITLVSVVSAPVSSLAQRIAGFSGTAAKSQLEIETKFKTIPSPDEARRHHRFLTAEPHPAGSERNNELARHLAELWKQQGWEDVTLRRYDVLNTFPREVSCEMISPIR